jgi:colicin import membrane protein
VAAQAQRAAAVAEADRRAQEAEALKLLRAKDEFDASTALKEEELQEMNDQLYEKSTLLDEAEEKAAGAARELAELRARLEAERRDAAAAIAARRGLEEDLATEREEKEKLQRLLQQAIG